MAADPAGPQPARRWPLYLAVVLIGLLAAAFAFWRSQGPIVALGKRTDATAAMEQQLRALSHPPGTDAIHQVVEEGPKEAGSGCPAWLLAGESRRFSGPRPAIQDFYPPPYQVVFVDEMKPLSPDEPFVILGYPPSGWGLSEAQIGQAYIVYDLKPSQCESGDPHHH